MSEPVADPFNSPEELQQMYQELRALHEAKGGLDYRERRSCLKGLLKAIRARKEALAAAVSNDFGNRSSDETYAAEIYLVMASIKHALTHLQEWMAPQAREVGWPWMPASAQLMYQPLGVVGVIGPWNYPIGTTLGPVVSAIAAGNRVLVKPSEETPHTARLIREILEEEIGKDVFRVAMGGADLGATFASLPLDHILFTGSTAVGKKIMAAASARLTPVTLELGGKSPTLIHPSYSVPTACSRIVFGKLLNAGQTCIAPDYALVQKDKVEQFVKAFKDEVIKQYPTIQSNPDYTSIVSERHFRRIRQLIDGAKDAGAEVISIAPSTEAGLDECRKIPPTLVLGATREMAIMQEEIFGPVLPVIPYTNLDEAIAYINQDAKPLAFYYFDNRKSRVQNVLERTISGGACINETLMHYAQESLPFGGVGASGMGAYHGYAGFRTFSHARPVFQQSRLHALNLLNPPHGGIGRLIVKFLVR